MGKYILITGAASGIGKATASLLAGKGFHVFVTDKNKLALEEWRDKSNVTAIYLDVTDLESIKSAKREVKKLIPGLDGLVNNAGIFDQFPLAEGDPKRFEQLMNVNVFGLQKVTQVFFPLLFIRKGRVVNMSSESAMAMMPVQVYGMSKRMLEVYSETLRMELNLLGMYVSLIRPGGHRTSFISRSSEVIGEIDSSSIYRQVLINIDKQGQKILEKVKNDPGDVAKAVYRALTDKKPRKIYPVNVSPYFRLLPYVPSIIKEKIVSRMLVQK